ncbi:hypothetical protein LOTGIDRAFT_79128, partial [Lottia gigantea]
PISEQEISKSIKKLKRGKSSGKDDLPPNLFIDGAPILMPILLKIFNYILDNNDYPKSWLKGILTPIPKKGNLDNPDNFRGINLSSVFAKLFSHIINSRL